MSAPDSQAGLPRWARRGDDGMIEVDPDQAYPLYLGLLGVQTLDQFWLEVARRCLTADLKALLGRRSPSASSQAPAAGRSPACRRAAARPWARRPFARSMPASKAAA